MSPNSIGIATGVAGCVIGLLGIAYSIRAERRSRDRLDIAHVGLVSLKPAIRGENRDDVIKAINDLLGKLQK